MRRPAASNDNLKNVAGPYMREAAALYESGKLNEAETACKKFLERHPKDPDLHNLLGAILMKRKAFPAAIPCFTKALELVPTMVSFHMNLAIALRRAGRAQEAVPILKRAMQLAPDNPEIYLNLGHVCRSLDNLADARSCFEQALALSPTHQQAWFHLAAAKEQLGEYTAALDAYDRAIALNPADRNALYNRGLCALTLGRLKEGFQHYELRWVQEEMPRLPAEVEGKSMWDGEAVPGTLLVLCEQGVGDILQCLRFLPEAKRRAGKLVVQVPPALEGLVRRLGVADAIVSPGEVPVCDAFIPYLSLPRVLQVEEKALRKPCPYLTADPECQARWKKRLSGPGKKVGLVWRGAPKHANDANRSMSLAQLAGLLEVPGVTFYSLQKGRGEEELSAFSHHANLVPLGAEIADYDDTAAILTELDLLISVDTSVVHLAGALGVPCWVMVPFAPDWRWQLGRSDSPWYPSLTLYRQKARKAWAPVVTRVRQALEQFLKD